MISIVKGKAEISRNLPGLRQCGLRCFHFPFWHGGAEAGGRSEFEQESAEAILGAGNHHTGGMVLGNEPGE